MKRYFCTYFDNNYLLYGMTLFRSLQSTGIDFTLFVACLDEESYNNLNKLSVPEICPILISDIEAYDLVFADCKNNRSKVEYYFTLSPILPLYIFNTFEGIDILGYLDSDLYFFSSPEPLFKQLGNNSILIFEHGFSQNQDDAKLYGRFNVAFQLYRNDEIGKNCLEWWRERCIEWCYDYPEDNKFADQKYLDHWPELFTGVVIANNMPGVALAPWNWMEHDLQINKKGELSVDGGKLIFYHYQGIKFLNWQIIFPGLAQWLLAMADPLSDYFYGTYYKAICKTKKWLKAKNIPIVFMKKFPRSEIEKNPKNFLPSNWYGRFKKKIYLSDLKRLLIGEYLFRGKRIVIFRKQSKKYQLKFKQ